MSENGSVETISGSTAANPRGVQRITITFENATGALNTDADIRSFDEAIGMLHRALLVFEAKVRYALAQQCALEAVQNAHLAGVAADVMRRGPRGA
jgi:hypothetical protein